MSNCCDLRDFQVVAVFGCAASFAPCVPSAAAAHYYDEFQPLETRELIEHRRARERREIHKIPSRGVAPLVGRLRRHGL